MKKTKREIEIELIEAVKRKEKGAFEKLCDRYLPLIIKISKEFNNYCDEAINAGRLGVYEAALRFREDKKTYFITFAYSWITRRIRDAMLPDYKQKAYKSKASFTNETDFYFSEDVELEDFAKGEPPHTSDNSSISFFIETLLNRLIRISPRSKHKRNIELIKMKFGIGNSGGPYSYAQLSKKVGLTPQRLQKIISRSIAEIQEDIKKDKRVKRVFKELNEKYGFR